MHFAATHLLHLRDTPKAPPACPSQRPIHQPVTRMAQAKWEVYALLPLDANWDPSKEDRAYPDHWSIDIWARCVFVDVPEPERVCSAGMFRMLWGTTISNKPPYISRPGPWAGPTWEYTNRYLDPFRVSPEVTHNDLHNQSTDGPRLLIVQVRHVESAEEPSAESDTRADPFYSESFTWIIA